MFHNGSESNSNSHNNGNERDDDGNIDIDSLSNNASIHKLHRELRRSEHNVLYRLRSIAEDAVFVNELATDMFPHFPVVANRRCGVWYVDPRRHCKRDTLARAQSARSEHVVAVSGRTDAHDPPLSQANAIYSCYFKSTDGHTSNWSMNLQRLNIHIVLLAAKHGGVVLVDSTRQGKRYPDSFSKTVPIWCCVLNRVIAQIKHQQAPKLASDWQQLHLPPWVSPSESAQIEALVPGWVRMVSAAPFDWLDIAARCRKPMRPIWYSRERSMTWSKDDSTFSFAPFVPVLCVSVSLQHDFDSHEGMRRGWKYIQGAGDDEGNWVRGLTPSLFWENADVLLACRAPKDCDELVRQIVDGAASVESVTAVHVNSICDLGSTGISVGVSQSLPVEQSALWSDYDGIIMCTTPAATMASGSAESASTLPRRSVLLDMRDHKKQRVLFLQQIPKLLEFAFDILKKWNNAKHTVSTECDRHRGALLLLSHGDHNIAILAAACILVAYYSLCNTSVDAHCHCLIFDALSPTAYRSHIKRECISKASMRSVLAYAKSFCPDAYPSRFLMKQMNNFFLAFPPP